MCKKAFPIIVAMILLLAAPASQAWAQDGEYYDLKAKIVELEKQLSSVNGLVKDLTYQVQENQALSSIVKELSFQLKKSEGDLHSLTNLQDRIERDVMPQIISLQSTISSLGSSLSEKIKALGVRVYDAESSIQQLSARIKSNEDRLRELDGVDGKVRELNERLYKVEKALQSGASLESVQSDAETLSKLEDRINSLSMSVSAVKSQVSDLGDVGTQVEEVNVRLTEVADGLSSVQFTVDSLRGRVSQVETAQADFATFEELGELRSQVDAMAEELTQTRSATSTNFLIGIIGVLAGIGAMGLVLLGS